MRYLMLISAVLTFLVDQVSKVLVVFYLDLQTIGYVDVFPPFLNFAMAWNYGVNFGLFSSSDGVQRWILTGFSVVVCIGIVIWMWREPPDRLGHISAGLLIGGALGNAFDRVVYGAVADFLNMSCCGFDNPYAFNVADIAIFAGAIGLAFFSSPENRV
ncbi:MAG: signal peptidase II [Paracoccaceae bacterium]|nr:signal peptidase II [Paracoccaceae bacterium]